MSTPLTREELAAERKAYLERQAKREAERAAEYTPVVQERRKFGHHMGPMRKVRQSFQDEYLPPREWSGGKSQ